MNEVNEVKITGNISSKSLELHHTLKGKPYCFFNVAVNREFGEGAEFVPVKVWGEGASVVVNGFKQGDKLKISGRISTSKEGDGDGVKYFWCVTANEIERCVKGSGGGDCLVKNIDVDAGDDAAAG